MTIKKLSVSSLLAAVSYTGPVLDRGLGLYYGGAIKAIEVAAAELGWRVLPTGIGQGYRRWVPRACSRSMPRSLKGLAKLFCAEAAPVEPSAPWVYNLPR